MEAARGEGAKTAELAAVGASGVVGTGDPRCVWARVREDMRAASRGADGRTGGEGVRRRRVEAPRGLEEIRGRLAGWVVRAAAAGGRWRRRQRRRVCVCLKLRGPDPGPALRENTYRTFVEGLRPQSCGDGMLATADLGAQPGGARAWRRASHDARATLGAHARAHPRTRATHSGRAQPCGGGHWAAAPP